MTRLSAINKFEQGVIRMIKVLRLAWLNGQSTLNTYFRYFLNDLGGPFIFECNYTIKDLSITSFFYRELLQWWSEFRDLF